MNDSANDWRKLQNILLLLLVLTFCLYFPTLYHDAFADDEIYLAYANRFLRESPWTDLYQLFLKPQNPWEFLPLRDFTYWLDFRIYGDEPNGFHATNLAWYGVSCMACFVMFRQLILLCRPALASRSRIFSLCGTLLFAVHPAHVEVAAWIASRKDLIAATLSFLALTLLVHALRRDWPWREVLMAAMLLFAACFGKASAMSTILMVVVLICMDWSEQIVTGRARKLCTLLVFWVLVALAFIIHLKVGENTGIRIENHPGLWVMLDRASRIFTVQIGILIFPYPLRFYYDAYQLGQWHWIVSAIAVLLLFFALFVLSKRRSLWALGVVLTLSPLFIYLQLMPFTTWSLASERFVFVSVAGLALMLIDLLVRLSSPKVIGSLLLLIVMPCSVLIWSRVADWGGGRSVLLAHEYQLQPTFHNAIRDHIGSALLPEKRFEEGAVLARLVQRPYVVESLLALLDTEQAYLQMPGGIPNAEGKEDGNLKQNFCIAVANFRLAIHNGYDHIPYEPDISYNNILRSLDRQLKYRYADSQLLCADDGSVIHQGNVDK
ncbi:MAG: hypothetical protein WCL27_00790 [Betaproteobacteria bacterium]